MMQAVGQEGTAGSPGQDTYLFPLLKDGPTQLPVLFPSTLLILL